MSPTMNGGYCDTREDEREELAQYERPCGPLILSAHRHVLESLARIERMNKRMGA
jgi:hypothetical protein